MKNTLFLKKKLSHESVHETCIKYSIVKLLIKRYLDYIRQL